MPVGTFRMWVLGFFWAIIIAGVNQFCESFSLTAVWARKQSLMQLSLVL